MIKITFKVSLILLLVVIVSPIISSKVIQNGRITGLRSFKVGTYNITEMEHFYVIRSFQGSGGNLRGGIVLKRDVSLENEMDEYDIEVILSNSAAHTFQRNSLSDAAFYIGSWDHDELIEIWGYEIMGVEFLTPIQIDRNGIVKEESLWVKIYLFMLASTWMRQMLFILLFVVLLNFVLLLLNTNRRNYYLGENLQ